MKFGSSISISLNSAIWYVEVRVSRSFSEGPIDFEITCRLYLITTLLYLRDTNLGLPSFKTIKEIPTATALSNATPPTTETAAMLNGSSRNEGNGMPVWKVVSDAEIEAMDVRGDLNVSDQVEWSTDAVVTDVYCFPFGAACV